MSELEPLRNLGVKSAQMLTRAGIHSADQIRQAGSVPCFLCVKQQRPHVSLNLLWALEGFLLDMDWRDLPSERKQELRQQLQEAEQT